MAKRSDRSEDQGVYIISVAAELAGVHPQTLRIYERKGLLQPSRTAGNTRRYSDRDIDRLRAIQTLTQDKGINLAGVKMIVEMENEIERMRRRMEQMQRELGAARRRLEDQVSALSASRADIVPVRSIFRFPWETGPSRKAPGTGLDSRKN
jgi:MerR family transcriptional regulator/heat shock protein HspR